MSRSLSGAVIVLLFTSVSQAQWIQWPVADGGNDHWYRLTATGLTWDAAEAAAVAAGGHLVAIGSIEENNWVRDQFGGSSNFVLWIGLSQAPGSQEPDGGWAWSNGEPLVYTNWSPVDPNDGGFEGANHEDFAHMYGSGQTYYGLWNDIDAGPPTHIGPGVIEADTLPPDIPAVSAIGLVILLSGLIYVGSRILKSRVTI